MRAEWLRIEAEVKALQSKDGVEFHNLHQQGYRLVDLICDLTPLQSWFMATLPGYIARLKKR